MTRFGIITVLSAFVIAVFTQMITATEPSALTTSEDEETYKYPKKVKEIIDKSCYGCHSAEGKSDKAKDALRWDQMQDYDKTKFISMMDDIMEVVEEREMPPEKYLEKNPDAKPTDKEYETLMKWAEKEADKLLK